MEEFDAQGDMKSLFKIIEKFKSSRDAKYSNKTLMELQTNLD